MKKFISTTAAALLGATGAMAQDPAGSFGPELDVSGFAGVSYTYEHDSCCGSETYGNAASGIYADGSVPIGAFGSAELDLKFGFEGSFYYEDFRFGSFSDFEIRPYIGLGFGNVTVLTGATETAINSVFAPKMIGANPLYRDNRRRFFGSSIRQVSEFRAIDEDTTRLDVDLPNVQLAFSYQDRGSSFRGATTTQAAASFSSRFGDINVGVSKGGFRGFEIREISVQLKNQVGMFDVLSEISHLNTSGRGPSGSATTLSTILSYEVNDRLGLEFGGEVVSFASDFGPSDREARLALDVEYKITDSLSGFGNIGAFFYDGGRDVDVSIGALSRF